MKSTRWSLGLLSAAGLLLSLTQDADAWLFHNCCGHCCDMHICCRQYNAFTPVCWGNVHCDGCCPNFGCGTPTCMPPMCCAPGPVCGALSPFPMGGGCGDPGLGMGVGMGMPPAGAMMMLPPGMQMPGAPMAPARRRRRTRWRSPSGPVPPILNHTAQQGNPAMYYGVQPASYYPGYYGYPQAYYPAAYQYNPYLAWAAMAQQYNAYGYGAYGQRPQ